MKKRINVYFSDIFEVSKDTIENYGAFNISLINDVPLFIDPFLLFGSDKAEYQALHDSVIKYLRFLRDYVAANPNISPGLLKTLFCFHEIKQNWLGFSQSGNSGSGLGQDFADALRENLVSIFTNFGAEGITQASHLEKLCIIKSGVGKDCISDFTTNLIMPFLLEYTQTFAQNHIDAKHLKRVSVPHVYFDYRLTRWMPRIYTLPYFDGDYVILTPKDILTKENTWINRNDMLDDFSDIADALPNDSLRAEVNKYFNDSLVGDYSKKDEKKVIDRIYQLYPELVDFYIRHKEDNKAEAREKSSNLVLETESFFNQAISELITLLEELGFYSLHKDTYQEAMERVLFLKDVIENKDGYRIFYENGRPITKETDLHILYRLTWYATVSDVNREVNNGRGPVDFKVSRGRKDSSLVEFKLASNSQLKRNLENQVAIYEAANNTKKSIKVIFYFSDSEYIKVSQIIRDLGFTEEQKKSIILIDASRENKISASKA